MNNILKVVFFFFLVASVAAQQVKQEIIYEMDLQHTIPDFQLLPVTKGGMVPEIMYAKYYTDWSYTGYQGDFKFYGMNLDFQQNGTFPFLLKINLQTDILYDSIKVDIIPVNGMFAMYQGPEMSYVANAKIANNRHVFRAKGKPSYNFHSYFPAGLLCRNCGSGSYTDTVAGYLKTRINSFYIEGLQVHEYDSISGNYYQEPTQPFNKSYAAGVDSISGYASLAEAFCQACADYMQKEISFPQYQDLLNDCRMNSQNTMHQPDNIQFIIGFNGLYVTGYADDVFTNLSTSEIVSDPDPLEGLIDIYGREAKSINNHIVIAIYKSGKRKMIIP